MIHRKSRARRQKLAIWGLMLVVFWGCKEAKQTKTQPRHKSTKANKVPTKRSLAALVRKKPAAPAKRATIRRPRPRPAPRWYQPKYRERRFRAPRVKLKQVPGIRAIPPTVIQEGPKHTNMVALTFDACSWNSRPRYDRKVIQTLIKTRTPATLFMGGMWVLKRQNDAKKLASYPFFEFANHSYLHGHLHKVSAKRLRYELKWTQEIIYTILGRIPTLFRPPYLEYNKKVAIAAGKLGLKTINGLASGDPDPTFTKSVLIRYMKKAIKPGAIVVMHMNKGGKHTAAALPGIIKNIKKRGYRLVTVSELLRHNKK